MLKKEILLSIPGYSNQMYLLSIRMWLLVFITACVFFYIYLHLDYSVTDLLSECDFSLMGGAEHFGKLRYCAYIIALVGYWLQADRMSINALENTANINKQSCLSDFLNKQPYFLNKPKKTLPVSRDFFPHKKKKPKSGLGNCVHVSTNSPDTDNLQMYLSKLVCSND